MTNDGSRIEAAEAGAHAEHEEGAHHAHVDAHDAHGAHGDDSAGGGHGHGADPNEGVLRGEPPTPAWVMTATGIGIVTLLVCVWLAFRIG